MPKMGFNTGAVSRQIVEIMPGSDEQEAIWKEAVEGSRNIVVRSVAGSGKTWTGIQYCLRERQKRIAFVAFNKHIQTELASKLSQGNVTCRTYHSLGLAALKATYPAIDVDPGKLDAILEELILEDRRNKSRVYTLRSKVRKMTSLAKQYGAIERKELEKIADHHLIDLEEFEEEVYDLVPKALIESKANTATVDYDDMIWLPKELGISLPRYNVMLIDEAQDTNPSQQWLALNSSDRLIVIGDPNQAIYGFRGADVSAMQRIEDALRLTNRGVVVMPLSFTRRCPKSHVELAQMIVPNIHPMPEAPEGIIRVLTDNQAAEEMKGGDLVVCRVNAELIGMAYKLIQRGVKAVVRGRDIGEGVEKLLAMAEKKSGSRELNEVLKYAYSITLQQAAKFDVMPDGKGAHRAAAVRDRYACLSKLAEDLESIEDVRGRIAKIFADFDESGKPQNAVVLGTVHRTKGLEAGRVYVLRPDLIPHPAARQEWERVQEHNLGYVAVTRAVYSPGAGDGELIFVGGESLLFVKPDQEETEDDAVSRSYNQNAIPDDSAPDPTDIDYSGRGNDIA